MGNVRSSRAKNQSEYTLSLPLDCPTNQDHLIQRFVILVLGFQQEAVDMSTDRDMRDIKSILEQIDSKLSSIDSNLFDVYITLTNLEEKVSNLPVQIEKILDDRL